MGILYAKDQKHPIYSQILKIKPTINKKYAMHLSNVMHKMSKKYNQDPLISVAIAMQESSMRNINRKQRIVIYTKDGYEIKRGYTDLCLFQIHVDTAIHYGMDLVKLNNNLSYCVEQHFRIMKIKRNACKRLDKDSWTCYHSFTKSLRLQYKKLVERFL